MKPHTRISPLTIEQAQALADDRAHGTAPSFWDYVDTDVRWSRQPWDESYTEQRNASCLAAAGDRTQCRKRPVEDMPLCAEHLRAAMTYFYSTLRPEQLEEDAMAVDLHATIRESRKVEQQSHVYFIGLGQHVKVGHSVSALYRFREIRAGRSCNYLPDMDPSQAVLWGYLPGSRALEQALHRRLSKSRVAFEWFRTTPHLYAVYNSLMETPGAVNLRGAGDVKREAV